MSRGCVDWSDPLARLTDEELVLLNAAHPAVLQPYLDTVPAEGVQLALAGAYRALRAHGLAPGPGGGGLAVPDGLVQLLQARESAAAVLLVTCTGTGRDERLCYGHLCSPAIVLEELDPDGIHSFHVVQLEAAGAVLQEFVQGCEHVTGRVWRSRDDPGPAQAVEQPVDAEVGKRLLGMLVGDGSSPRCARP